MQGAVQMHCFFRALSYVSCIAHWVTHSRPPIIDNSTLFASAYGRGIIAEYDGICIFEEVYYFAPKCYIERLHFMPMPMDHYRDEQLSQNSAAESIQTNKLCSRFLTEVLNRSLIFSRPVRTI